MIATIINFSEIHRGFANETWPLCSQGLITFNFEGVNVDSLVWDFCLARQYGPAITSYAHCLHAAQISFQLF